MMGSSLRWHQILPRDCCQPSTIPRQASLTLGYVKIMETVFPAPPLLVIDLKCTVLVVIITRLDITRPDYFIYYQSVYTFK